MQLFRIIVQAKNESPIAYDSALAAGIRALERADQIDEALSLQRELLAFNRAKKFEEVRRILRKASVEETDGTVKMARLETQVDRKVTDLANTAINQSRRAGYDHDRTFRVSRLAELFAASLQWQSKRVRTIGMASKLIDLGMMVISDDLICKPRKLTDAERELVDEHARFGAELLISSRLALLEPCVPIVRFHHERWDGTGSASLKGDVIPVEPRLVALCDSFDALTHERPWRHAFSLDEAVSMIGEESGTHFDPNLTERFISWVKTETGKAVDFDAHLAAEAMENDYVRTRKRIEQLIGNTLAL